MRIFDVIMNWWIKLTTPKPMPTLYIIRGIPGSGKSTLARQMATELGIQYFEADQFFVHPIAGYVFDKDQLGEAHSWCFDCVRREIIAGHSVIVSNTFSRWREMRDYVDEARLQEGHQIKVIWCLGDFGSVHGVPQETMDRMRARFIPNDLLPQSQGIIYSTYLPVAEFANLT